MTIYIAKMTMHDATLSTLEPSRLAVGVIYVALKICEQLRNQNLITEPVVRNLIRVAQVEENEILEVSQQVLHLAQNFDVEFPAMVRLRQSHFSIITRLL